MSAIGEPRHALCDCGDRVRGEYNMMSIPHAVVSHTAAHEEARITNTSRARVIRLWLDKHTSRNAVTDITTGVGIPYPQIVVKRKRQSQLAAIFSTPL